MGAFGEKPSLGGVPRGSGPLRTAHLGFGLHLEHELADGAAVEGGSGEVERLIKVVLRGVISRRHPRHRAVDRIGCGLIGLIEDEDLRYAIAYALFKTGEFGAAERHLAVLTRADLFRKAAELRRAMQDCRKDRWKCL